MADRRHKKMCQGERVLSCYHQPGRYVWLKELPPHIKAMKRSRKRERPTEDGE